MVGDKRVSYTHQPRNFGGRGAIKCGVCGDPILEHKSMELCKGKKVKR